MSDARLGVNAPSTSLVPKFDLQLLLAGRNNPASSEGSGASANHRASGLSPLLIHVISCMEKLGVSIDPKTGGFLRMNIESGVLDAVDPISLTSELRVEACRASLEQKRWTKSDIQDALGTLGNLWMRRVKENLRRQIKFDPTSSPSFAAEVLSYIAEVDDLDVLAFRHALWCTKRRIFGLPVEYTLLFNITGATGAGKSVFMSCLLAPLAPFTATTGLHQIIDSREHNLFAENYALFFDELSGADRAEASALKRVLSTDVVCARALGTNIQRKVPVTTTYYGTSNTSVRELVYDPTSARRFWEVTSRLQGDWDSIKLLNGEAENGFSKLWQSIDENGEAPILSRMPEVRERQHDKFRAKDSVEEFVAAEFDPKAVSEPVPIARLFNLYRDYCQNSNTPVGRQVTISKFSRRLGELGYPAAKLSDDRSRAVPLAKLPG